MFTAAGILRTLLIFSIIGIFITIPVLNGNLNIYVGSTIFFTALVSDWLTIPAAARWYASRGIGNWALILYSWYILFYPGFSGKRKIISDMSWIFTDKNRLQSASMLLSALPENVLTTEPECVFAYSRLLLIQSGNTDKLLDFVESALSQNSSERGWYIRGIVLLKNKQYKEALKSFENARIKSMNSNNIILLGQCYLFLGIVWKALGHIDYSKDHLLKAEVLLDELPPDLDAALARELPPNFVRSE